MKKIERFDVSLSCLDDKKVAVLKSDLNQLEREREEQQKIIDELKANNFALSAMVCKHPDKRTLDENYDSIKDYCDVLIAENPDVPCPACEGERQYSEYERYEDGSILDGEIKEDIYAKPIIKWLPCDICNHTGTVSTAKALQYENKQLKAEIKKLEKYMYEISAMMGDKR